MIAKEHPLKTIVNDVESEDERSIPNSNKRNSMHSDWSDLLSVNEEVEYRKIYKNRSEPNIIGVATTSAASTNETIKKPSVSPIKRTVKNMYWCHIHPNQQIGEVGI